MRGKFLENLLQDSKGAQLLVEIQNKLTEELIRVSVMRDLFKNSQVIFVPHHGTNTKNSQNFLGFFSGRDEMHLFIVCSSPFGPNSLPKVSTLDMAPPFPMHPEHPFLYCRDHISYGNMAQLRMITKPIYATGSAPAGLHCLIIDEKDVFLLDMFTRHDNNDCRWINALTGEYVSFFRKDAWQPAVKTESGEGHSSSSSLSSPSNNSEVISDSSLVMNTATVLNNIAGPDTPSRNTGIL
jgi:hypothetical protein